MVFSGIPTREIKFYKVYLNILPKMAFSVITDNLELKFYKVYLNILPKVAFSSMKNSKSAMYLM